MENHFQNNSASKRDAAADQKKQGQQSKAPEAEGYDKKLDGPNRPSI